MVTFEEVIKVLTDTKMKGGDKMKFCQENDLDAYDLIDVANYITIERNFYKHQCEKLSNDS